ncbi:NADP-dependent phosphogluconate dehydrogenase [Silicimonas algicola]|uniref:6-phosphogluconate dehydrogenase, decarboxylating n=1 Tax=Silicimonas algicola TaxID=1826607 RepID=A0A316G8W1_9RHOB|nr:NADP-dependent phosphogluconate dehydrogenase [Silicimonas algicola]AZQ68771.1 NADP-dependent phosphogluconate dehydrogenase [Silicimonas algicola]PWK56150.1 6-phosphogluconate dehydrogenase [Silicimonas algicola]
MARIGLTGLGTMGAALAMNIAEKGFPIAVHNRTGSVTDDLMRHAGDLAATMTPTDSLAALAARVDSPRTVIIMVAAGDPVDQVIGGLVPHLDPGDCIVDAGNADFNDTRRRSAALAGKGIAFLGMGVSGGEEGARHGPSIMVGGPQDAWDRIADIVTAIAARYEGEPCAARLGADGAGHFVKTVHNGIEYADMQVLAEVTGLMRADGRAPADLAPVFRDWNDGPLKGYLVEITAEILATSDTDTGKPILDVILDSAGQKGTGRWTVIEALKLGQSATAIEAAVAARAISAQVSTRAAGEAAFPGQSEAPGLDDATLHDAVLAARVLGYGQGFSLLQAASEAFDWSVDLARVAEIWRAGCIIRSALLDDIATAIRDGLPEGQLFLAPSFADTLRATTPALRRTVARATETGQPVPAMSAALSWFDAMRRARGTADLIQAQRDFFGRHGFQRTDRDGKGFHGPWAGPGA